MTPKAAPRRADDHTGRREAAAPDGARPIFRDDLDDPTPPGAVVGSRVPDSPVRRGVDREARLSIEPDGLRITAPAVPGFGRHALRYGPFAREPGMLLTAYVLNGHNASQTAHLDARRPLLDALRRSGWRLKGAARRLVEAPLRRIGRRFGRARFNAGHFHFPSIRSNLAVGFVERSSSPTRGHAFVIRSANHECGELNVVSGRRLLPVLYGLQNLPICFAVLLRPRGAVYFAASLPGAPGMGAHPSLRPLAIDPHGTAPRVSASVDQAILGEINFSVDTRVFGLEASVLPRFARWYGSAHVADSLRGQSPIVGTSLETDGLWSSLAGASPLRTSRGLDVPATQTMVVTEADAPSGLLHVRLRALDGRPSAGIVVRAAEGGAAIVVAVGPDGAKVERSRGAVSQTLMEDRSVRLRGGGERSLQVSDDGRHVMAALDGRLLFPYPVDIGEAGSLRVGLFSNGRGRVRFEEFEAHPREVRMDEALRVPAPWWVPPATAVAFEDDFAGPPGELAGRWRRTFGRGRVERSGDMSARVHASPASPNPGRTLYTFDWEDPELADIEVEITPPGAARGERQLGRGGLVILQDEANYLVVNAWNDDVFPGNSVSSFLVSDGREDLYRAVWTNVGARIKRGVPFRMRLVSDGLRYLVFVGGEPVLYRAITDIDPTARRLRIERAGLAVNWEFGDDTGTRFRRFVARAATPRQP